MIEKELKMIQIKFHEMEMELNKRKKLQNAEQLDHLGEVVKKERKNQKLTLRQLSELSSVSYSALVRLESGDDGINLNTLKKVADTLGLKLWIG